MGNNKQAKVLTSLRPHLPRGFRAAIVASCEDVSLAQVKRAFAGGYVATEPLTKIVEAACKLAAENKKNQRANTRKLQSLIKRTLQCVR